MKKLSRKQQKELKILAAMPDREIDLTDIPEITNWSRAVVGKFYRRFKRATYRSR
jgi:hypothetical protein